MSYSVTIDSVDVSPIKGSVTLDWAQNGTAALTFAILVQDTGTISAPVQIGDAVTLVDDSVSETIFAGFVRETLATEITNHPTGTYTVSYRITAADYSGLLQRRLVNAVYTNDTFEDIVADIVTNYLDGEGITTTNVVAGPTITKAIFSWRTVADAFNELSDQTGYAWWIDSAKDLHFEPRGTSVASLSFSNASRPFTRLVVRESADQYTNAVTVWGGRGVTSTLTETMVGDGTRRVFNVAYPVAEKPSGITAAGGAIAAGDIGIRGLDTGKKWYWSKGSTEIEQDALETVLSSVQTLVVQYKGLYRIVVQAANAVEIAARAAASAGTSGRWERLETDASIEDTTLAADKAAGLLRRFGTIPKMVDFTTDNHTCRPGQVMTITLPELGLSGDFLIDRIRAYDRGDDVLRYDVTALSGETLGGWQSWWRRFIRRDRLDAVGDEFVIDLEAITETLTLTPTEAATEVTGNDRYLIYAASASGAYALNEYGAF